MKVTNEIKIYEVDGTDTKPIEGPTLLVESHWNNRDMVVLVVGGHKWTLVRRELDAAVANATNTGRLY